MISKALLATFLLRNAGIYAAISSSGTAASRSTLATSSFPSTVSATPTSTSASAGASFPPVGSIPRDFSPQGLERLWDLVRTDSMVFDRSETESNRWALLNHRPSRPLESPLALAWSFHPPRRRCTPRSTLRRQKTCSPTSNSLPGSSSGSRLPHIRSKALSRTRGRVRPYGTGIVVSLGA
jgi:hypothetical protein